MNYYAVVYSNDLTHYGVKGMKWGKRKAPDPAKERYRNAKATYRQANKDYRKNVGIGVGIKGLDKATKARDKLNKAEMDFISEKARYKATKSERAEFNTYVKEMKKSGLKGSGTDQASGGRSTRLYNKIKQEKGKQYADAVQKKLQTRLVADIVGGVAVGTGMMVVGAILENQ